MIAPEPIPSRDLNGGEHQLTVRSHCAFVAIEDETITRLLSQDAALALGWELIDAAIRMIRAKQAGPFSSTY
jgi:hypothetical protein